MGSVLARKIAAEVRRDWVPERDRAFDLEQVLEEMEIDVVRDWPQGTPGEAMSLDLDDREVILADPSMGSRRFRFTLAHELGHLLLSHGAAPCSTSAIHGRSADPQEQDANAFASELLMPSRQFRPDIRPVHPRIEELSALADEYDVSLTATAIRYVTETHDYCAIVGLREDGSYWFKKSDRATWFINLPPGEGTLVHARMNGIDDSDSWQVGADVWLKDFVARQGWDVTEDVVQVVPGEWVVLLSELPDPDDDPDLVGREIDEELERRRMSFRRY